MAGLDKYFSHPDKKLITHVTNVVSGVKKRTDLKIAELSAIFHDIGKLNPNFQEKLKTGKTKGYSNHSYLSSYIFLCYLKENYKELVNYLGGNENLISSILAIITSHHKNLPDFPQIFHDCEKEKLSLFLTDSLEMPSSEFLSDLLPHSTFNLNITLKEQIIDQLPNKIRSWSPASRRRAL